jgi:hypothetical protein
LQRACAPALSDLDRSQPGLLSLGPAPEGRLPAGPWGHGVPELWLWDTETTSGTGLWQGEPDERPGDAVLRVTEVVQDAAIVAGHGAWPACPDHPDSHPLKPGLGDGTAVWSCPVSGRPVASIGELPAASGRPTA